MNTESLLTPIDIEPDSSFTLQLHRPPRTVITEARLVADALIEAVKLNNWVQKFSGRDHLYFEAWAFLGSMFQVSARTVETRLIQIGNVVGYEAFAEAVHMPSGRIIGKADSMCLNDEENWSMRPVYEYREEVKKRVQVGEKPVPLFQLRSMAQTRAQAKALKGPLSWIVAMAGYAPVPAEELGEEPERGSRIRQPQARQTTGNKISEAQQKRLWAIARDQNKSKDETVAIIKHYGFDANEAITRDKYDEIIAELAKSDSTE